MRLNCGKMGGAGQIVSSYGSGMQWRDVNGTETRQSWSAFRADMYGGPDDVTVASMPMLFEGARAGSGRMVVTLYRGGVAVASAEVSLNLQSMSDMYEHYTVGDTNTMDPAAIPTTATPLDTRVNEPGRS